jgi:GntR family transcriptional repressor for pyruvate dehydrogenase complex
MQLQPTRRISLSQAVLDQLLARIQDGSIKPGDHLPSEHVLMRQLNVGRSSVREALRGLISLGLVETKPGRGGAIVLASMQTSVHLRAQRLSIEHLQKSAILDLLEVRESLEGQAAQLAAERATSSEVAEIGRCAFEVEKQVAEGRTYFHANSKFHFAVARASHNSVLAESVRHLIGEVRTYRERLMREIREMPERDVAEHQAILKAIQDHDPNRARRVMIKHLRSFAEVVRSLDAASTTGWRCGNRIRRES